MNSKSISKILVANRGEIACRVIRTCKELGIRSVAVFSEIDRTMPHVLMADEAYLLGPAAARESYLNGRKILEVAAESGADAIHPGYGFLSENAEFARQVQENGFIFIGPDHFSIRMMGDKTAARKLMQEAGVPVVPGTTDPVLTLQQSERVCEEIAYPVLVKSAGGGGGKGMRIVRKPSELSSALRAARSEAASAFGDDRIYIEKYIDSPRHIEFQIVGDRQGKVVHLGERECSIQRRHQKVVEESPSVLLDEGLRARMGEAAVKAALACKYLNAGTVEFLVDKERSFYFLEMNTRLQVEHPVTELRTGLDIVAEQIRIAAGQPLGYSQADVQFRGHAIECRIYAENPENDYMPSTGTITHLRPAFGPGVRDDRGIEEGGEISLYYDPLISKLIVWAQTRDGAIRRMTRALREYEVLGVSTNIGLNLAIMEHPKFRQGVFDTQFLDAAPWITKSPELDKSEKVAAAVLSVILYRQQKSGPAGGDSRFDQTGFDAQRSWSASKFRYLRE